MAIDQSHHEPDFTGCGLVLQAGSLSDMFSLLIGLNSYGQPSCIDTQVGCSPECSCTEASCRIETSF